MPAIVDMVKTVKSYPVEDRVILVDALLSSLNGISSEIDSLWGEVAERRLEELRTGVEPGIPADVVLAEARSLCSR